MISAGAGVYRVRPFEAADAEGVVALAAILNADEEHPATPQPLTPAALAGAFLGPCPVGLLLVAEAGGALLGYATGHVSYETNHAQRGLYVGDLCVHPSHRRRGVGRALMAGLAAAGRARGGAHIWWTARPGNEAAHAMYRALGAREEDVRAFAVAFEAFDRLAGEAR